MGDIFKLSTLSQTTSLQTRYNSMLAGNVVSLGASNWIASITTATSSDSFYSLFTDNNLNCYLTYNYVQNLANNMYWPALVKLNSSGSVSWNIAYKLNMAQGGIVPGGNVDSNGNIYWAGFTNASTPNTKYMWLFSTNSNGIENWQTTFNASNISGSVARTLTTNPSKNALAAVTTNSSTVGPQFARFDTSGNLTNQQYSGYGTQTYQTTLMDNGAVIHSNGGQIYTNSANTIVWTATAASNLNVATYANTNNELYAIDNNGVAGKLSTASNAVTWSRNLTTMSSPTAQAMFANNTYNYTVFTQGATSTVVIVKRDNSTGSVIWQRQISISGTAVSIPNNASFNSSAITTDSTDTTMFIQVYVSSTPNQSFVWKLPADGSKTGTYTIGGRTFVYAASSFTDAAFTATRTSMATLTPSNPGLTTTVGAYATQTQAVTTSKLTI